MKENQMNRQELITDFQHFLDEHDVTNGDMVRIIFDERGYNAIREKMEHTLWWNQQYKLEKTE